MEKQHQHGQNGAQLDHIAVHIHKLGGDIQFDKFIHQDEMAGGADGQPLGDAFHHAKEEGL